jgi:hypothetical protein
MKFRGIRAFLCLSVFGRFSVWKGGESVSIVVKVRYRNPNEGTEWKETEKTLEVPKELIGIFAKDYMNRKQGNLVPDTTGAEYYFLEAFITERMSRDFAVIEQDFLRHCRDRLSELNAAGWYGEDEHGNASPKEALQKKIMRFIYNGAKTGDEYCMQLLLHLYKVYHKREYKQLKRFRVISVDDIFSFCGDERGGFDYGIMGRILVMSRFVGVRLEDQCSVLFLYLDNGRREDIAENEAEREYPEVKDELFEECIRQVELWTDQNTRTDEKAYGGDDDEEFVGICLRNFGYRENYARLCMKNDRGDQVQLARTLALLKTWKPKQKYTYKDLQRYAVLYQLAAALADVADSFDKELRYLLGSDVDELEKEPSLFQPENMVVRKQEEARKTEPEQKTELDQKAMTNIAPVGMDHADAADYLKEIAALRGKLHDMEQKQKHFREQYRQMKKLQSESEKLIEKYQSERDELIALREFAHRLKLVYEPVAEEQLEDMKKVIADKKIVIIGGHINWINKLKKQFPEWLMILPEAFKTVDGKMLVGKDRVYFFTDHISHVAYGKFIAAVRTQKIPFGYLSTMNMDQMIRQIYEDVAGRQAV